MVSKTSVLRYLIKVDRVAAWVLLVALILFFVTGYTMTGEYGFNKLVDVGYAIWVHTTLCEIVIALLAYHAGVRGYLELKRLGIFKGGRDQMDHGQEEVKGDIPSQEGH